MRRSLGLASLLLPTFFCATVQAANASEHVTYQYDALGRLIAAKTSGTSTINPNLSTTTAYDPAGNRTQYNVSGSTYTAPQNATMLVVDGPGKLLDAQPAIDPPAEEIPAEALPAPEATPEDNPEGPG